MKRLCPPTLGISLLVFFLIATAVPAQDFKAILGDPERPQNETGLDAVRKPEEVLKFYGIKPGDKVADIMTGRGYYAAILSQLVGDKGMVYAASATVSKDLAARFERPRYKNVKLIEGKLEVLELPQDGSLDFALIHLNYHDLQPAVRTAMNRRIFAALKPGGAYGVVDHSAKDGSGNEFAQSLHRIDKALVIKEVTEAGFALSREGEMLRQPEDPRTERDRRKSDRFVLRFEKRR